MPIRVTLRDMELLQAILTARYMTTDQIVTLFWRENRGGQFGQRKAGERRLRILRKEAGLIRAIEPLGRRAELPKPYIYTLTAKGAALLSAELGIDLKEIHWTPESADPAYPFLRHLLLSNDLHLATRLACDTLMLTLVEWLDEKVLRSEGMSDVIEITDPHGKTHKAAVVPDFCCLIQRGEHRALFFGEVDRSTVTISPSTWEKRGWRRKVRSYIAYFDSDAYKNRYGNHLARVLTITNSEERLQHLKQATEQEHGDSRFWFATADNATDPAKLFTEKIWYKAGSEGRFALLG